MTAPRRCRWVAGARSSLPGNRPSRCGKIVRILEYLNRALDQIEAVFYALSKLEPGAQDVLEWPEAHPIETMQGRF